MHYLCFSGIIMRSAEETVSTMLIELDLTQRQFLRQLAEEKERAERNGRSEFEHLKILDLNSLKITSTLSFFLYFRNFP